MEKHASGERTPAALMKEYSNCSDKAMAILFHQLSTRLDYYYATELMTSPAPGHVRNPLDMFSPLKGKIKE